MAGEAEPEKLKRRGSLGRAFERVRNAMSRRSSSGRAVPTLATSNEESVASAPPATGEDHPTSSGPSKVDEGVIEKPGPATPVVALTDSHLEVDDNVDEGTEDSDGPFQPLFSSRNGISDEKAQALFKRYGLKYTPRPAESQDEADSPIKLRRVERAVHMRIHWTCHECHRQFGHDKTCVGCGHRRCQTCIRAPGKKLKVTLDQPTETRLQEERLASKKQILAATAPAVAAEQEKAIAADTDDPAAGVPLELDAGDGTDLDLTRVEYTFESRPRAGMQVVMRPRVRNRRGEGQVAEEEPFVPTMVATVQRVHRKARQRVRWTCEKCDTIFTEGKQCRNCDHKRCDTCMRTPPKRVPPPRDPAVIQSVNERIEAWQRQREQVNDEAIQADVA